MASQKSSLKQEQLLRQHLLPQQVRFGEFLEKSAEELAHAVETELEANPALERKEGDEAPADDRAAMRYYAARRSSSDSGDDYTPVQAEAAPTLREALLAQLAELDLDEHRRRLAAYIVDAIDSNGYLTRTLPELADDIALSSPAGEAPLPSELREAYATVRSLDPPGVGGMDLRDTLLLQLQRLDPSTPLRAEALEVVTHFFDVYSRRNDRKLAELTGLTPEAVSGVHKLVLGLNPRPGAAFVADPTQAMGHAGVTPDFIVETDGDAINIYMPNSVADLQLEESFREGQEMPGAEEFIRNRRAEARSFMDMLLRRRELLMRIMQAIVSVQKDFFLNGDDESLLKPMVLRHIASMVGVDLSMVSRAVSGKWVATELGVYPLKWFFNHRGAEGAGDDDVSSRAIRAALRDIVKGEDPQSPLSDEELVVALATRGYKVARRTVAKYRAQLSIPAARLRRR